MLSLVHAHEKTQWRLWARLYPFQSVPHFCVKHGSKDPEFWEHLVLLGILVFKGFVCSLKECLQPLLEANHRDGISVLPISCFCLRASQWHVQLAPMFCGFSASSPFLSWEDSDYGFSFLALQLYFGRGPGLKKNPTMECTSSCCKRSVSFMASCETHRISLVRAMCHLIATGPEWALCCTAGADGPITLVPCQMSNAQ